MGSPPRRPAHVRDRPPPPRLWYPPGVKTYLIDLLDHGRVRQAIEERPADPDDPLARLLTGWWSMGQGQAVAGATLLRPLVAGLDAVEEKGEPHRRLHAHAVLALGVATVMAGQPDAGSALLDRALSLHRAGWPRAQALRFWALALEQRGAWQAAAERYQAAAAEYATVEGLHGQGSACYGAATALMQVGEDEQAEALIETALDLLRRAGATQALGAAIGVAALLSVEREGEAVLALFREAGELVGDDQGMYTWNLELQRGEVLLTLGRAREALAALEGALALIPPDLPEASNAALLRALATLRVGETEAAAALLAEDRRPGTSALTGSARIERAALRLRVATSRRPIDVAEAEQALDELGRGLRAGWRRRGVAALVAESAAAVSEPGTAVEVLPLAARALQLAVAFGHRPEPGAARALRQAGAAIALGPLTLEMPIGRGGMGEVWRARHRDGRQVAVKLLRIGLKERGSSLFEAEIQALARLDHPNVVPILAAVPLDPVAAEMLDLDDPAGRLALVMELVGGGSLDELIGFWDWPSLRAVLLDLLAALAHAHARGVLHLDLKPANVLLDPVPGGGTERIRGRPRLTDFGLAGLAEGPRPRSAFGTPSTMAPEQADPHAPLGPPTDLYALGCLAWRLASGRYPFTASSVATLIDQHRRAELPALTPIHPMPDGLEPWLCRLLAKRPGDRFACAADAAAALLRLEGPAPSDRPLAGVTPEVDAHTITLFGAPTEASFFSRTFRFEPPTPALRTGSGADDAHPAGGRSLPAPAPNRPASMATPFVADWRRASPAAPRSFFWGAGEGLFRHRVGHLVGREAERDRLWAALGAVHEDGCGRALWIRSAPGLGGSALLGWLRETAQVTGAAVPRHPDDRLTPLDRPALLLLDEPDRTWAERRIGEIARQRGLLVVLSAAAAPPGVEELRLRPMADDELRSLLDARLPLDRELAAALVRRALGSPAFAVALLTDLVSRDVLMPGPEGFRLRPEERIILPERQREAWNARLNALAPAEAPVRAAWSMAATLGPRVRREAWQEACVRAGLPAAESLFAPLVAPGWVEWEDGDDVLAFRAPAAREALLLAAGPPPGWHGIAAEVLPPGDPERGVHLAAAGRHAEALVLLRRAAADAVNATRLFECRTLLEQWERSADALGMAADDPRRAAPLVVRVHLALHSHEDPLALLDRGLTLATGETRAQLLYTRAWVLIQQGRHAEAETIALQALDQAHGLGLGPLETICRLALATARHARGCDAAELIARLRAEVVGDRGLEIRVDACEGRGALILGQLARAEALLRRAIEGAQAAGAPEVQAEAWGDLAALRQRQGDEEGELDSLERATAILAGTGSDKALRLQLRLALALERRGRHAESAALRQVVRRYAWRLSPEEASALGDER